MVVAFDYQRILRDDWLFWIYRNRPGILIEAFARTNPEVTEAIAEISDGAASGDGWISFCSVHPGAILVPDCDFYASGGHAPFRSMGIKPGPGWSERDGGFVWRGSSTGKGPITADEMTPGDSRLIQRTRFCLAVRGMPDVDAKLFSVVQSEDGPRDAARLGAAGIFGDRIDSMSWRSRKFAFDIDGNSNAWSNLFTRLLLGCCVIKIGSPRGFRQWYYADLRPFEHFVPVAADLADLAEKLEWCRGHDRECAAIAAAGQEFALRRTLESEVSSAVGRLNRAFGG